MHFLAFKPTINQVTLTFLFAAFQAQWTETWVRGIITLDETGLRLYLFHEGYDLYLVATHSTKQDGVFHSVHKQKGIYTSAVSDAGGFFSSSFSASWWNISSLCPISRAAVTVSVSL